MEGGTLNLCKKLLKRVRESMTLEIMADKELEVVQSTWRRATPYGRYFQMLQVGLYDWSLPIAY